MVAAQAITGRCQKGRWRPALRWFIPVRSQKPEVGNQNRKNGEPGTELRGPLRGPSIMFYNNLIYFLVAIFVFSTSTAPKAPTLGPLSALFLSCLLLYGFSRIAARLYGRARRGSSRQYFAAEKKLSLLALLLFACMVYLLDLKYYLQPLSFGGRMPILVNAAGLGVFFLLLSIMWLRARPAYEAVFHRSYSAAAFVASNIKSNLPIVLPWLVLSLAFDLLAALPLPKFQEVMSSPWGDLVVFMGFVIFLALFFPPLVRWLWGCRPLPPGPLRERIEAFCRRQNLRVPVYYWPLFEGQVLTAGIMGILPGFRYLLVTPALLATLNEEELDSVLAHEIGHVKRMHLVLYVLLFLGFSILAGSLAELLPVLILGSDMFYRLLDWFETSPEILFGALSGLVLLVAMLLYFRFVFGYFIRNFERQADLFVFRAQGTARPLISSFEKIAALSGNIRDQKSWHHFGIGERIDFLARCEQDPSLIRRHDRKVFFSLAIYFTVILVTVLAVRQVDTERLLAGYETRYTEAVLRHKVRQEPGNSLWLQLLGDLLQGREMERKAMDAYEKALALSPMNADLNNNLAWLLLTARDRSLRDPVRALTLARTAAVLKQKGYILDTLATAFWANHLVEEAVLTELKAIRLDPENRAYYQAQIERFRTTTWGRDNG